MSLSVMGIQYCNDLDFRKIRVVLEFTAQLMLIYSLKVSLHDPVFEANCYSNSKQLVMPIHISMG